MVNSSTALITLQYWLNGINTSDSVCFVWFIGPVKSHGRGSREHAALALCSSATIQTATLLPASPKCPLWRHGYPQRALKSGHAPVALRRRDTCSRCSLRLTVASLSADSSRYQWGRRAQVLGTLTSNTVWSQVSTILWFHSPLMRICKSIQGGRQWTKNQRISIGNGPLWSSFNQLIDRVLWELGRS